MLVGRRQVSKSIRRKILEKKTGLDIFFEHPSQFYGRPKFWGFQVSPGGCFFFGGGGGGRLQEKIFFPPTDTIFVQKKTQNRDKKGLFFFQRVPP